MSASTGTDNRYRFSSKHSRVNKEDGMAQREMTAADYLSMLRRHWIMILMCTLLGGPLAYGVARVLPVKYKSQTLVLIEQQSVPTDYVKAIDTSDISQRLSSMQQQIL